MYFLGVDPGIRKLGFAIIDESMRIFELGAIINELQDGKREDNIRRLYEISEFFDDLLAKYKINGVCIEKLFFTKFNQGNAEFVYGVRGILLDKFFRYKMNIIELSPKEIKKYTTGSGSAGKLSMQNTVKKIFSLQELPQPHDAADALAMAYIAKNKFLKLK